MSTLEQQLRTLGEHLEERHPPITARELSSRPAPVIDLAPRRVPRRLVLAAVAALVLLVVATLALFDRSDENSTRTITEPDRPEEPEQPDPPSPVDDGSVAPSLEEVAVAWTPIDALGAWPEWHPSTSEFAPDPPVLSDGSRFFAAAPAGEVRFSDDGADWRPLSEARFDFLSTSGSTASAHLAAVHDGAALVIEVTGPDELAVSRLDPTGSVERRQLDVPGTAVIDAAMGPAGMLVLADGALFWSGDGAEWQSVQGAPLPHNNDRDASGLAATAAGFVGLDAGTPLFSPDGRSWQPVGLSDGTGLGRFRRVWGFRGGAVLDGVGYVSADGRGSAFVPVPAVEDGHSLAPALSPGDGGIVGLISTGPAFPVIEDLAIGDGTTWTRLGLPEDGWDAPPTAVVTTADAIVVVSADGRAWRAPLTGVGAVVGPFPNTAEAGSEVAVAEEVGRTFLRLRDEHDADATAALFAPGATMRDGTTDPLTDPQGYAGLYGFFAAVDWRFAADSCVGAPSGAGTVFVSCRFREGNAWSQLMTGEDLAAPAPADRATVDLEVGDDGLIVDLWHSPAMFGPAADGWMAFRVFVENTHPDDVESMYASLFWPEVDSASLELWARHTREFVDRGLVEELTSGSYRVGFAALQQAEQERIGELRIVAAGDPPAPGTARALSWDGPMAGGQVLSERTIRFSDDVLTFFIARPFTVTGLVVGCESEPCESSGCEGENCLGADPIGPPCVATYEPVENRITTFTITWTDTTCRIDITTETYP